MAFRNTRRFGNSFRNWCSSYSSFGSSSAVKSRHRKVNFITCILIERMHIYHTDETMFLITVATYFGSRANCCSNRSLSMSTILYGVCADMSLSLCVLWPCNSVVFFSHIISTIHYLKPLLLCYLLVGLLHALQYFVAHIHLASFDIVTRFYSSRLHKFV